MMLRKLSPGGFFSESIQLYYHGLHCIEAERDRVCLLSLSALGG